MTWGEIIKSFVLHHYIYILLYFLFSTQKFHILIESISIHNHFYRLIFTSNIKFWNNLLYLSPFHSFFRSVFKIIKVPLRAKIKDNETWGKSGFYFDFYSGKMRSYSLGVGDWNTIGIFPRRNRVGRHVGRMDRKHLQLTYARTRACLLRASRLHAATLLPFLLRCLVRFFRRELVPASIVRNSRRETALGDSISPAKRSPEFHSSSQRE